MEVTEYFYGAQDIMQILKCSQSTSYSIMKSLNEELEKKGYKTKRGRVSREYFLFRFGLKGERGQ